MSLAREGARGGTFLIAGQLIRVAIQMVSLVLLARLLTPAEFGIVALATVVVSFGDMLRDAGTSAAALQARQLSHQQASNLFWVSLSVGALAAAITVVVAPVIAGFYAVPQLTVVLAILASTLLFNSAQAQVQVQMARSGMYFSLAWTDALSQLIALLCALALALAGLSYWALVGQLLTASIILVVARCVILRWRPSLPRRGAQMRPLILAGAELSGTQILTYASGNADTVVIGANFGTTDLGVYNRAFQLLMIPISAIYAPLTNVMVPLLNKSEEGADTRWRGIVKVQFSVAFLAVGVFTISAASAPTVIPLVLGDRWSGSAVLYQILAVGGCFQAFSYVSYWMFLVGQASRSLLLYNLLTKTMTVMLVVIAGTLSTAAVAAAYSIALMLSWPINLWWLKQRLQVPASALFRSGLHLVAAGATAFLGGTVVLNATRPLGPLPSAILSILCSAGLYAAVVLGSRSARETLRALRDLVRRRMSD